jgi:lipopolysaccharide cholinephosphotransferase
MLDGDALKRELLAMLDTFDLFCRRHDLRYTLLAGTLLGAVRHQGFIPWDDDIDLAMPRPDFERLCVLSSALQNETGLLLEGYLGTPLEVTPVLKVANPSIMVKPERETRVSYLWIDVSPIDGMPDDETEAAELCRKTGTLQKALNVLASTPESGRTALRRAVKRAATPLGHSRHAKKALARRLSMLARAIPYGSTHHVGSVAWGLGGERERVDAEGFAETVYLPFEGHRYPAMACWEQYLSQLYGPYYAQMPSKELQISHHAKAWRIEKDKD